MANHDDCREVIAQFLDGGATVVTPRRPVSAAAAGAGRGRGRPPAPEPAAGGFGLPAADEGGTCGASCSN